MRRQDPMAPLANLGLVAELIDRLQTRPHGAPGMAGVYGPSGYGKSFAASFAGQRTRAYYVEMGDTWTRKTLCQRILREITGSTPMASLPDMVDEITDNLAQQRDRPLIIDEADYLLKKGMVDLVREIHDRSHAPVIWIGEEMLPHKLKKFERTDNRMYDWVAAQPCLLGDARHLAKLYAPGMELTDDLLEAIVSASGGRVRRVVVNLGRVVELAKSRRKSRFTLADLGTHPLFTGEPPRRRVA